MKASRLVHVVMALFGTATLTGMSGAALAAEAPHDSGSQPVYSYANAIRETAWVDTGLKNPAGAAVRVAADIIRPSEPAGQGKSIPTIMDASPYYSCCGRGNESQLKTYDGVGKPVEFPLFYDNYFVPRGYAVVLVDLAGTNRSNGCVDVGGPSDITSAKAVIDWLGGRATAYSTPTGSTTVTAGWSNGLVGMIGKSYDGTIANGVAATGVAGLKTIVPISAISSWYDYYRANGTRFDGTPAGLATDVENAAAQSGCSTVQQTIAGGAPNNGDYTPFWAQRNYYASAANVHASVFVAHGVSDLNVKTINFGQWWNALAAHGVERKIWLSQTGHVDPFDYRRGDWVDTLHRWFDHYLMGVDNGIQNEPGASVERTPDHWTDDPAWPAATTPTTLKLTASATNGLGTLGSVTPAPGATESFTDTTTQGEGDWIAQPDTASGARTLFSSGTLGSDVRVSGTSSITVTATPSASSARLSAILVDLGPETIRNFGGTGEGITTLTTKSCWGDSSAGDSACYLDTKADTTNVSALAISRGWADLGHYASLDSQQPLTPGKAYTMTFSLASTDHVVPAGHRLALIIAGTDHEEITGGTGAPTVVIDLTGTTVKVPLVGTLPA